MWRWTKTIVRANCLQPKTDYLYYGAGLGYCR